MKSKMYKPDRINVGYQNRSDTYTGKLGYIIYFDEDGKLRKETSWENWRNADIPNTIFDNEPTEGFVLNRSGGGRPSWSDRKAFVRVYDPRGFEFEIDIANLMYILECCPVGKGKVLEGKLVYVWDGKELVLLPVDSPDYKDIDNYTQLLNNKEYIKGKDLKVGYTYVDKNDEKYVYLGKFHEYDGNEKSKTKKFFFAEEYSWRKDFPWYLKTIGSLGKKFIKELEIGCVEDFTPFQNLLETSARYSPIDDTKDKLVPMNPNFVMGYVTQKVSGWSRTLLFYEEDYTENEPLKMTLEKIYEEPKNRYALATGERKAIGVKAIVYEMQVDGYSYWGNKRNRTYKPVWSGSLEEFFCKYTPCNLEKYLENGKLHHVLGKTEKDLKK